MNPGIPEQIKQDIKKLQSVSDNLMNLGVHYLTLREITDHEGIVGLNSRLYHEATRIREALTALAPHFTQQPTKKELIDVLVGRIGIWDQRRNNPKETLPGMTSGEVTAYYLGHLREAEAVCDLVHAVFSGKDYSWAVSAARLNTEIKTK